MRCAINTYAFLFYDILIYRVVCNNYCIIIKYFTLKSPIIIIYYLYPQEQIYLSITVVVANSSPNDIIKSML